MARFSDMPKSKISKSVPQADLGLITTHSSRDSFLDSLRSPSSGKYKRLTISPIRYAGGKSKAVGTIIEHFPASLDTLISPFFGGGSVELATNRFLGSSVVGYEIFDVLVNYWEYQINEPQALFRELQKLKPTAGEYARVKEYLKQRWDKHNGLTEAPAERDGLKLAAYYWFNHNLSYGPGFLGWPSKMYLDPDRYSRMIARVRDFEHRNLNVRNLSFQNAFSDFPQDFFYCDPPYFLGESTQMFKGLDPMRNFPVHHDAFPHEELRDLLLAHKGDFVLSYNDCEEIRDWYSDFQILEPVWQYTMGQGEMRIGKNRQLAGDDHVKQSHELLIVKRSSK
jgi:DNA adenine methylase